MTTRRPTSRRAAFTMVEIALCIAIIGFGLVAIIGVLPIGLKVQRDNREETIINADARHLLEAMRIGAADQFGTALTNYFDQISYVDAGGMTRVWRHGFTYPPGLEFSNDAMIVGLMSQPYFVMVTTNPTPATVTANVRAFSGAIGDRGASLGAKNLTFSYQLQTMVIPLLSTNPVPGGGSNFYSATNASQILLDFRWPLLPNGQVGGSRKVFRTLIPGVITNDAARPEFWFFSPSFFLP